MIRKNVKNPSSHCEYGFLTNREELEITDVNNIYISRNGLHYDILENWWLDAGTHEALFEANKHFFERLSK